jgi:hypothetical protein
MPILQPRCGRISGFLGRIAQVVSSGKTKALQLCGALPAPCDESKSGEDIPKAGRLSSLYFSFIGSGKVVFFVFLYRKHSSIDIVAGYETSIIEVFVQLCRAETKVHAFMHAVPIADHHLIATSWFPSVRLNGTAKGRGSHIGVGVACNHPTCWRSRCG